MITDKEYKSYGDHLQTYDSLGIWQSKPWVSWKFQLHKLNNLEPNIYGPQVLLERPVSMVLIQLGIENANRSQQEEKSHSTTYSGLVLELNYSCCILVPDLTAVWHGSSLWPSSVSPCFGWRFAEWGWKKTRRDVSSFYCSTWPSDWSCSPYTQWWWVCLCSVMRRPTWSITKQTRLATELVQPNNCIYSRPFLCHTTLWDYTCYSRYYNRVIFRQP